MEDNIYEKVLKEMKKDGAILQNFLPDSEEMKYSLEKVIKILESSSHLIYDETNDLLKYLDSDGVEHIAPDLSEGVTESSVWLCDKLPIPIFDFDQGGNTRRIVEARAIYTIICIGVVFSSFKEEILDLFKKYNFSEFSFKNSNEEFSSMSKYLSTYLDMNSIRINSVVSSASIRMSRSIEKKDAYWKSMLTLEEIAEFGKISRDVKNINSRYERDRKLNPSEMPDLTKIQKLSTIEERDLEIEAVINKSYCCMLYKISKLSSERLTPSTKKKIYSGAQKIARSIVLEEKRTGRDADERFDIVFKIHSRLLTRMAITSLRTVEIEKYKKNPNEYKFIKKI